MKVLVGLVLAVLLATPALAAADSGPCDRDGNGPYEYTFL